MLIANRNATHSQTFLESQHRHQAVTQTSTTVTARTAIAICVGARQIRMRLLTRLTAVQSSIFVRAPMTTVATVSVVAPMAILPSLLHVLHSL